MTEWIAFGLAAAASALILTEAALIARDGGNPVEPHAGADETYAEQLEEWLETIPPVITFAPVDDPEPFRMSRAVQVPAGRHRAPDQSDDGVPAHLATFAAWTKAAAS